jgi:hypothetical protein
MTTRGSSTPSSSTTSVHLTALDDLVNVNSLFTIAVFVGLSLNYNPKAAQPRKPHTSDAGIDVAKNLLVFEAVPFSFFLISYLIAQGLMKLAIYLLNSTDVDEALRANINLKVLRFGMMGSAIGSVMGCVLLMLSMINVMGILSCGSKGRKFFCFQIEKPLELLGIYHKKHCSTKFELINYLLINRRWGFHCFLLTNDDYLNIVLFLFF